MVSALCFFERDGKLILTPKSLIDVFIPILIGLTALSGPAVKTSAETFWKMLTGFVVSRVVAIFGIDLQTQLYNIVGIIGYVSDHFADDFISTTFFQKYFSRTLTAAKVCNEIPLKSKSILLEEGVFKVASIA